MASHNTTLAIVNNTPSNIVRIKVDEMNNYDWDGDSRPDHNFKGKTIGSYKRASEREELNANASSAWYTMELEFANGDVLRFRNDQYDARRQRRRFICLNGEKAYKYQMIQASGHDSNTLSISPAIPSYADWMQFVKNDIKITELTIPGTHDTGTYSCPNTPSAQCQDLCLRDQLDRGIRFIDIRCTDVGGRFSLHHSSDDLHLDFEHDIVKGCADFLNDHPYETIIMSVKWESGSGDNFGTLLDTIVERNAALWYIKTSIPTLGEARGKIVLFRRSGGSHGIYAGEGWPDDAAQSYTCAGLKFAVQDAYMMSVGSISKKWELVKSHLNTSFTDSSGRWYLNFSSAAGGAYPSFFAKGYDGGYAAEAGVNLNMFDWLVGQIAGHWGTILMDYPECPDPLIAQIISLNKRDFVSQNVDTSPVRLYEHEKYGGWMLGLGVGRYKSNELGFVGNDRVTSLRVKKGYRVTLWEHDNFNGNFQRFSADVSDVGGDFNDRTSSVKVEQVSTSTSSTPCTLYADAGHEGRSKVLQVGSYDHAQLGVGNDTVSSIKVAPGYQVTLYEHGGFSGAKRVLTGDSSYIGSFNDKVSSVKVERIW